MSMDLRKTREKLQPVLVRVFCPKCDRGQMRSTGHGYTTLETEWEHACDACDHRLWLSANYPRVEHDPVACDAARIAP